MKKEQWKHRQSAPSEGSFCEHWTDDSPPNLNLHSLINSAINTARKHVWVVKKRPTIQHGTDGKAWKCVCLHRERVSIRKAAATVISNVFMLIKHDYEQKKQGWKREDRKRFGYCSVSSRCSLSFLKYSCSLQAVEKIMTEGIRRTPYRTKLLPVRQTDNGTVELPRGKVVGSTWQVVRKLGEGGCGSVYLVRHLEDDTEAAMKAESNGAAGGCVLKLEVAILKKLSGKQHVAQFLFAARLTDFSYVIMTLLGESLNKIVKWRTERNRIQLKVWFQKNGSSNHGFVASQSGC